MILRDPIHGNLGTEATMCMMWARTHSKAGAGPILRDPASRLMSRRSSQDLVGLRSQHLSSPPRGAIGTAHPSVGGG